MTLFIYCMGDENIAFIADLSLIAVAEGFKLLL